jgi:hypothetical protein
MITLDSSTADGNKNYHVDSLRPITRRLIVLLIVYVLCKFFTTLSYELAISKSEPISTAFSQYQSCGRSTPQEDCIDIFRKHALPQLLVAADFVWQVESILLPAIFMFAYKEVRSMWLSVVMCCFTVRRKRSRENKDVGDKSLEIVLQAATTPQVSG